MIESIRISQDKIELLDQTLLPEEEKYILINDYREMIEAIKRLSIRGAPALGIAAAAGIYLAAKEFCNQDNFKEKMYKAIKEIELSRPTAVNLFKASEELQEILKKCKDAKVFLEKNYEKALALMEYEKHACEKMGENALKCIDVSKPLKILTHCNTGSLATYGIGTALGVIRTLAKKTDVHVFADETRPLLQGSRLTMWELMKSGIKSTLISDNMAAATINLKEIDLIITGADRIAANGDSANKIGTYNLAILADYHKIPFYIAAPETTIDRRAKSGKDIPIEERGAEEVRAFGNKATAPNNCDVFAPAFDVTPADLITAIITEKDVYSEYNFQEEK